MFGTVSWLVGLVGLAGWLVGWLAGCLLYTNSNTLMDPSSIDNDHVAELFFVSIFGNKKSTAAVLVVAVRVGGKFPTVY